MVCDDPDSNRYIRANKAGVEKTHVQFFDIPPSRAWVPAKSVFFSYNAHILRIRYCICKG